MFLPPRSTPFICSRASCAASGKSYSTNANPCNITGYKKAVSKDGYKRNDIAFKVSETELWAAVTVFSLNLSSVGKGPFMASKAKNRGTLTQSHWEIQELSSLKRHSLTLRPIVKL